MKKVVITTAFVGLVGTCALSGFPFKMHAPHEIEVKTTHPVKRDRLYFAPDVFWANESPQIKEIRMKSNSLYYGVKGGYDFLRPGSFYGGAHASYAMGKMHIKAESKKVEVYDDRASGTFANAELRFGYNFAGSEPFFFTPFIGVGGYHVRPVQSISYDQNWAYAAAGVLADAEISPNFSVGLNAKLTHALYLEQRVRKAKYSAAYHKSTKAIGYEFALPITFHIGETKSWDLQVEPYYLNLNIHNKSYVVGGQLNLSLKY